MNPTSRLPEALDYVLLLELLDEVPERWLPFVEREISEADLASDEAFESWVMVEKERDPTVVTRTRNALSRFREDLLRGWNRRDRGSGE